MECVVAVLCTGQEALRGRQGWAPGAPAREGWVGEHGACPGPNPPRMARSGVWGLEGSLQLTAPQAQGPDEEAAQTEGGGHAHAARHGHHHPVVEAHAGLAAELRAGVGGQRR